MRKVVDGDSVFEITNLAKEEWVYRYSPNPVADQITSEQDTNVKDGNGNLLEDLQAKMELLREAMNNVDEAVKSFVKQQGKEKKKKPPRGKKGGDIAENVKTKDDKKGNLEEGNALDDKDAIKENVDIAVDIKKMIQDVVARIDNGNVKVDEVEIKDFYPKDDEEKVDEGKDSKMSKEKVDTKKKSKDKKKAGKKGDEEVDGKNEGMEGDADGKKVGKKSDGEGDGKNEGMEGEADGKKVEKKGDGEVEGKNEGMEGDADGKKVAKKSDGDADGKNEGKEGVAITEDNKDMVDEAQT